MTRTFVRGRAPDRLRTAYEAVAAAQDLAIGRIRDGADPAAIHEAILSLFRDRGFETGQRGGRMGGFFHGTGHGLGLDIHEAPTFGLRSREPLRAGHVVTVEPGLYYRGMGGVRLEDVVVVQRRSARNLVTFERELEI
jgi:Xaa-Pro aminopeptidase